MIKINKINDITFVLAAVTDFSDSLGYCEYKVPLSMQGVKPRQSQALIQGTKAHHEKGRLRERTCRTGTCNPN